MRKRNFENKGIYHIYNRGVDGQGIFLDGDDYQRFLDFAKVYRYKNLRLRALESKKLVKLNPASLDRLARPLVEVLAYVLVKNHFHFILRQMVRSGITKFMHKLGTLYTLRFNEKHKRSGRLFEGSFKSISVPEDNHLFCLSFYIHLHPAEFIATPKLRGGKIKNWEEMLIAMEEYKWSSYRIYLGKQEDKLVNPKVILNYFKKSKNSDGAEEYKEFIEQGLREGNKRLQKIEELLWD